MKPKSHFKPIAITRFLVSGLLLAAAAHAQTTYVWDADGDATVDTGGSGIWDKTSALWRTGDAAGALAQWPNLEPDADVALLGGIAGTLTLNSDSEPINLNRIIFETTGYEIAAPASGTATLNLSGATPTITTAAAIDATISASLGGDVGLTKNGDGTLTLSGNNTYTGQTSVTAPNTNNSISGIVNVSGDQSAADGGWAINGDSTVNFLPGSTITVRAGRNIALGNSNSSANFALNVSGKVTTSSTSSLSVRGRRNMNLESGAEWTQSGPLNIQPLNTAYTATVNVRSGASFTYDGNLDINLARATSGGGGSANLNISGGTFTTSRAISNAGSGTGGGATNLNLSIGGILRLSADVPSLILRSETTPRVFNVTTGNGGGVIDTNGFSTLIDVPISGNGGPTKTGTGTLTLAGINTYRGDTSVTGGTLILAQENLDNDSSSVTIGGSGVLQLTYAGTDTVDKLFIEATQQAAGVYGHSSTGATNGGLGVGALDDRFAEGTGTLTVASNPSGTPFETFMAGYPGLTGNDALPEADPDGDGLSNIAEFIMGGTAPDRSGAAIRPLEAVINGHLTVSILVPSGATFAGVPSPSATVQGVQVAVGGSLDLTTFDRTVEETALNPGLPSAPTGHTWHTFRLSEPITSQSRGFLRASFSNQ